MCFTVDAHYNTLLDNQTYNDDVMILWQENKTDVQCQTKYQGNRWCISAWGVPTFLIIFSWLNSELWASIIILYNSFFSTIPTTSPQFFFYIHLITLQLCSEHLIKKCYQILTFYGILYCLSHLYFESEICR